MYLYGLPPNINIFKTDWQKLLLGFGLYNNIYTFAKISRGRPGIEHLSCLDGVRFMSISWVALGHSAMEVLINSRLPLINVLSGIQIYIKDSWTMNTIANGLVSVDSFFLLSGCLVAYLTFKDMEKSKGRFNIFFFYLHRYLR